MSENNSSDRIPPPLIKSEWEFPLGPLPREEEFGRHLDGKYAWEVFGELTRPQAFRKFMEHTIHYADSFTWMGPAAFVYYYPVIERYLGEYDASSSEGESEAWTLAHAISAQFSQRGPELAPKLWERVLRLACYVRTNLDRFALEEKPQRRIDKAWLRAQQLLSNSKDAGDDRPGAASN